MKLLSFKKILESEKPYIIKFTDPDCHLCVELKPIFHKISKEFGDKFEFGNVTVGDNQELTDLFVSDGVPAIYVIDKKQLHEIPYPSDGYGYDYLKNYLTNLGY
jgi:thioredoxin-like negative regulator of GroEL